MPLPALTAAAMRRADKTTIEEFGIPGFTLMESAGRAASDIILEILASVDYDHVLILCGKGNNGGDGLVIARQLGQAGHRVRVRITGPHESLSETAAVNFDLLKRLIEGDPNVDLEIAEVEQWSPDQRSGDNVLIVDALLGTGLDQAPRGSVRQIVKWINEQPATVVSLDVPTGLDTDRGIAPGACVEADLTITMGAAKVGLLVNDGPALAGHLEIVEIGIPEFILNRAAGTDGSALVATDDDVIDWFPERAAQAHKYSVGMVLAAVGSRQYTGAAVMSTMAALRIGAGYVVAGVPSGIRDTLAERLVEVALTELPETDSGGIAPGAISTIADRAKQARALLVGCGIGKDEDTLEFVHELVDSSVLPGVLDADGLNAIRGKTSILKKDPRQGMDPDATLG